MNKRQYCESRESIAYYSGLNGLEIKGIEYGISKNAIKNKSEMFVDLSGGGVKQVGYVITGKTEFDKGDYTGYSTQYIDLWVTILTVVDTVF